MIRAAALANYLSEQGVTVHVVCLGRAKSWDLFPLSKGVQVHPVKPFLARYDLPRGEIGGLGLVVKVAKRAIDLASRGSLIDFEEVFLHAIERKAADLIDAYGIANVIVSSPPHSLQTVGVRLKRRYGSKLMLFADFRDPWTIIKKYQKRSAAAQRRSASREAEVFLTSDHVAVVSKGMETAYKAAYPAAAGKIAIIRNGFIPETGKPDPKVTAFAQEARREGRVLIGYFGVGGVGSPRNDAKDLDALFALMERAPDLGCVFALVLQGDIAADRTLPAGFKLLVLPPVSNAQARANMECIDLGIVLHTVVQSAPLVVGGKIFDYIASRIGVWMLVPTNAESLLDIAAQTRKPFVSDVHSQASLEGTAREIVALHRAGALRARRFSAEETRPFSRAEQYRKVLETLQ